MSEVLVQIIGAPIACKEGVKDAWREVAAWVDIKLQQRFGDAVLMKYYDLFDMDCPPLTPNAQLPVVLVDGDLVSSGGKISVPTINRKIETVLEHSSPTVRQPD
jgi:hypothetical protein